MCVFSDTDVFFVLGMVSISYALALGIFPMGSFGVWF